MKSVYRQLVLYVATMGMVVCWFTALLLLVRDLSHAAVSIPGLLAVYPVAFFFNRLLLRRPRLKIAFYAINVATGAFVVLLMIKLQLYGGIGLFDRAWLAGIGQALARIAYAFEPEVLLLLGGGLLWWLGFRLARLRPTFAVEVFEFQFGLAMLLIIFFVSHIVELQPAASVPLALAFFLLALLGMSIAHSQEGSGWLSSHHQGFWSGLLLAGIGLVLVIGVLIGSLLTPDLLQLMLVPVRWLWNTLWQFIVWLASLLPAPEPAELPPGLTMPAAPPGEGDFKMWTIPDTVLTWLRFGYYVIWIGFIALFLWRISSQIVSWMRRRMAATTGAEYEPLSGAFKADLLGFLRHIFLSILRLRNPFRRRAQTVPAGSASVRQVYRQLLHWADSRGWSRPPSQTPHEYLGTLQAALPLGEGELRFITEQYVRARYSPQLPSDADLQRLRHDWSALRQRRLKARPEPGQ